MTGRKLFKRVRRRTSSATHLSICLFAIYLLPMLGPMSTARPAHPAAQPTRVTVGAVGSAGSAGLGQAVDTSPLTVSLTAVTPPVSVPEAPVRLTGRVRNSGTVAITSPIVRALIGQQPLTSRQAVSDWASPGSAPSFSVGEVARSLGEVARASLGKTLAPGSYASFSLTIPATAVSHPGSFAVLPLRVEVIGTASAVTQELGDLNTFLPTLASVKAFEPMSIAWLVPLTLDPDPALHGMPSTARTAAWTKAIGPGSRLDRLIQATAKADVTWAIDPAILGPSQAPSGAPAAATGSQPTPSGSQPTPQQSAPVATATADPVTTVTAALAAQLKAAAPRHTLWSLPYADPDLAALFPLTSGNRALTALSGHPSSTVDAAVGRARADIAWPVTGTLTPQTETWLHRAFATSGLSAAVTSASTLTTPDGSDTGASRRSSTGLPLLAYDESLSRTVAETSTKATGAITIQRFLADSMALLGERPGTRNRSVLIAEPRTFAADPTVLRSLFAAVAKAPWLVPATTGQLLAASKRLAPETPARGTSTTSTSTTGTSTTGATGPTGTASSPATRTAGSPSTPTPTPTPTGNPSTSPTPTPTPAATSDPLDPGGSPLTPGRLESIPGTLSSIAGIASILGDGDLFRASWSDAQVQQLSARWRGHPEDLRAIDAATRNATSTVSRSVKVAPSSVNFFADRGVMQVTVVNDLAVPIHDVHLTLVPSQPRLRIEKQPGPLKIGAKSRTTVPLQVTSIAAGIVNVEARLTTRNGTRLGQSARVSVRVQPPSSWIYWVLGGLAGIVLVLGTLRSLRRGSTRASRPDAQEPPLDE